MGLFYKEAVKSALDKFNATLEADVAHAMGAPTFSARVELHGHVFIARGHWTQAEADHAVSRLIGAWMARQAR